MPEGGGYTHHPHQYLEIDMATKNNKEINRALGITSKEDIYSLIKQGV